VTARIAGLDFRDAAELFEDGLEAPEAAAGKRSYFHDASLIPPRASSNPFESALTVSTHRM